MIHGEDLARARLVTVTEALQEEVAERRRRQQQQAKDKAVTVGEALHSVARSSAGAKPVDFADAAAIQAAVALCATGSAGGEGDGSSLAARAMQAAETNVKPADERSGGVATVRLKDVLGDAADALPGGAEKRITREDAEKVADAARSNAGKRGAGTGKPVVEAFTAAADMNEK